jgi:hypothetical protein
VKRLIAFVSICALWPLASCGVGEGTFESCVGPYTGRFQVDLQGTGTLEGRLLAYLGPFEVDDPPDRLDMRLTLDTETTAQVVPLIISNVSDTGAVAPMTAGIALTGSFDFDSCEASGTWGSAPPATVYTNGTWRLSTDPSAP